MNVRFPLCGARRVVLSCLMLLGLATAAEAFDSPEALQNAFLKGLRANDVEAMASCYADDAADYGIGMMAGTGPDAVRNDWQGFFARYRVLEAVLPENHHVQFGDYAASWGLWKIKAQPLSGGDPVDMAGRFTDVAQLRNGQWLYIADHASVPLPPPPKD